jgi:hypothetical protein
MREKDAHRLAGIDKPGDLLSRLHVFCDKLCFFRVLSHWLFVALDTACQLGNPRETAVFPEIVTPFTLAQFLCMKLMAEVNGLLFFTIKNLREDYPPEKEKGHKTNKKGNHR